MLRENLVGGAKSGIMKNVRIASEHVSDGWSQLRETCFLFLLLLLLQTCGILQQPLHINRTEISAQAYLFPASLLISKSIQSLVQRVSDDSTHCLIPSPIRIHTSLPEQMCKGLLSLFDSLEPVMGDDWIIRQVGSGRQNCVCSKGKGSGATGMWSDCR